MLTTSKCITLRAVKYGDSRLIVSCFAREIGRVSVIVNDGAGREARRRRALMMPGSTYQCIIDYRENRTLQTLREVTADRPRSEMDSARRTVAIFASDFLNSLLRDSQADQQMFDYVDAFLDGLCAPMRAVGNLPLCFLVGLQPIVGIQPDPSTYAPGYCLDMSGGIYRATPPVNGRYLDPQQSGAAAAIMRMNRRNMHLFRLTREQRSEALDILLDYYRMHTGAPKSLNSLDVLRSLFDL